MLSRKSTTALATLLGLVVLATPAEALQILIQVDDGTNSTYSTESSSLALPNIEIEDVSFSGMIATSTGSALALTSVTIDNMTPVAVPVSIVVSNPGYSGSPTTVTTTASGILNATLPGSSILVNWYANGIQIVPSYSYTTPSSGMQSFSGSGTSLVMTGGSPFPLEIALVGIIQDGELLNLQTEIEATIPEPSTWAMMLIGFAGLGFAGYRRAKAVRAALAVRRDSSAFERDAEGAYARAL